jgi:hypothetical protein
MGVGIVATRPISQGEQIFISYSGDDTIEDTWGEIFRCYFCHCKKSCATRGGGPLGSKSTEPVSHRGIGTSKAGLPPKKDRKELQQHGKRKRNEQGTPDLEPSNKKRNKKPPVPQDISSELGVTCRPKEQVGDEGGATEVDRDAFAEGHHQEISAEDKGADQNSDIKTKCLDTTDLVRSENPHTGDRSSGQRSGSGEKRNEKGSIPDETDEVHMESIGGRETVCNPYPLHRKDMDPAMDDHLPQTNGSDTGQWDDQYRDSKGQDGASQRSVRDQNMDTNTDDSRDMIEWGDTQ